MVKYVSTPRRSKARKSVISPLARSRLVSQAAIKKIQSGQSAAKKASTTAAMAVIAKRKAAAAAKNKHKPDIETNVSGY